MLEKVRNEVLRISSFLNKQTGKRRTLFIQENLIELVVNSCLKESLSSGICLLQNMISFDLGSEYLMLGHSKKKTWENLDHDQLMSFILCNDNHVSNACIDLLLLGKGNQIKMNLRVTAYCRRV